MPHRADPGKILGVFFIIILSVRGERRLRDRFHCRFRLGMLFSRKSWGKGENENEKREQQGCYLFQSFHLLFVHAADVSDQTAGTAAGTV